MHPHRAKTPSSSHKQPSRKSQSKQAITEITIENTYVSQNQQSPSPARSVLGESLQSSIIIQDAEERKQTEEDFVTDRLTEQSQDKQLHSYTLLEADDERISN